MEHSTLISALDDLHLPWRPIIRRLELRDKALSRTQLRARDTRSVRRASGLVLVGQPEVMPVH